MTQAPLASEVRDARAEAERAGQAAEDITRIMAALGELKVIMSSPLVPSILPGEAMIDSLAHRWPPLAALVDAAPIDGTTQWERIRARDLQLQSAKQALTELAASAPSKNAHLRDTLAEQRRILLTEPYSKMAESLRTLQQRQSELAHEIAPVERLYRQVQPALDAVRRLREVIETQITTLADKPAGAAIAHRVAGQLAGSCAQLLDTCGLRIAPPPVDADIPTVLAGFARVETDLIRVQRINGEQYGVLKGQLDHLDADLRAVLG